MKERGRRRGGRGGGGRREAYGEDDVFLGWDLFFTYSLGEIAEIFVDFFDNGLRVFAGEDEVEEFGGCFFGKSTVFSAFHVETFDFKFVDIFAVDLDEVDSSVLLLGVEKEPAEDIVDVDLEELVAFVDSAFELLAYLESFLDIVHVAVEEDRVRVAVDNTQLIAFCKIFRATQNLTTFESREHGKRSSVESRLHIAKTAVHGISR